MESKKLETFRKSLRAIERDVFSQYKDGITCCGISLAQCHVILDIGLYQKTTISQLSDNLNLDKSTLSRTIDGLVNMDFVERVIDPKDRRYMKLSLTEQGKKICNNINDFCNKDYQKIFDRIPKNKHDQVIESVALLAEAMIQVRKNKLHKNYNNACNEKGT
jgi:DNA-binding MarR family transcriptional regulator